MNESWLKLKAIFHAAIELDPEERDSYITEACAGDEGLRTQVERLLSAHEESGAFLVSPAQLVATHTGDESTDVREESRKGQRIGPYKVVREIGHGGMGSVFLAVRADDQYRKEVAIKVVRRGMDTDTILRRFMMERQILANLEHPNIARLIDGGSTSDGLPYFVMEYVEGESITDYCDNKLLTIPQRLELFRSVCSALHYAHQNLIVHRDIKPSNILVTADGVPKLLDFGIAKLLGPNWNGETSEHTASIVRLMTPEYASPEQFRGLAITTSTDVYSLGLVLYQLLSGQHPYQIKNYQPEDIARFVLEQEPEKPSVVISRQKVSDETPGTRAVQGETRGADSQVVFRNPKSLRGDLDNIVLKALRKEPHRRYSSVQEFSEDIRRHLEGLPVTATPDTLGYRTAKFVRRHKTGAIAAAAVVVTLMTATVITAWQAQVARRERVKAEQRFNDVRKLANAVVFELHDSIQDLPGSTPARELLVTRALEYLDKLAIESDKEPSLQLELAAAYDKVGDIQGGFATSHLGQRQKATESYQKGLAIRESLVAQNPNNVEFLRQLSTSYTKVGQVLWIKVDVKGALESYRKALEINKRLADQDPTPSARLELAKSYGNFGYLLGANGRGEDAVANLRQAVVLMEELAAADPNSLVYQRDLALSYDNLALILTDQKKDHTAALELFRKSQKIGDAMLAADPSNTRLQRGQGVGEHNIAQIQAKLNDIPAALESYRRALVIFKKILAADPKNDEFQQAVATTQASVCDMMIKSGEAIEAVKLLMESLEPLEKSYAASPTDEIAHFRIAVVQSSLGEGHKAIATDDRTPASQKLAHWREALSWFQKSRDILQSFKNEGKLTGDDLAKFESVVSAIAESEAAISRSGQ